MKGLVVKSTGSWYEVRDEQGNYLSCRIKGKFRLQGIRSTNPVAVGDWVAIERDLREDTYVITEIYERRNYIIRRSVNLSRKTQVIAANIDMAYLLVTLRSPQTTTGFIDRFLSTAEAYDIPLTLLFNKFDSYTEDDLPELEYMEAVYTLAGYKHFRISAVTGLNIDRLLEMMKNKVNLLSGHSGVGKSTLANALQPELELRTSEISEYHQKGQHTTTFAEMFALDQGGYIIDTPGIKGFGLVDMDREDIGDYFPEIFRVKHHCKFHNCLHLEEPGCAVKKALENNEIAPSRYQSYVNFVTEEENSTYRTDSYE